MGEVELLDVFVPASLVWAIAAGALLIVLRRALQHAGFYRFVWHPGLFDLALFVLLWAGLTICGDALVLGSEVPPP